MARVEPARVTVAQIAAALPAAAAGGRVGRRPKRCGPISLCRLPDAASHGNDGGASASPVPQVLAALALTTKSSVPPFWIVLQGNQVLP